MNDLGSHSLIGQSGHACRPIKIPARRERSIELASVDMAKQLSGTKADREGASCPIEGLALTADLSGNIAAKHVVDAGVRSQARFGVACVMAQQLTRAR